MVALPEFVVDPGLEVDLSEGMDAVEVALRAAVESDYPFVTEASRHLVDAGGKRFRPLLTLLSAQFGDPHAPGVVPAAVVVELTHLATLYHDDVMDEAALRRGAPSANARWDNTVAILTGDFLFARASDILADLGPEAVRIQARTFERLCTGQIRETVGPNPGDDPVQHHLQVLADKTGSLIATSGRFGGMMSGASPQDIMYSLVLVKRSVLPSNLLMTSWTSHRNQAFPARLLAPIFVKACPHLQVSSHSPVLMRKVRACASCYRVHCRRQANMPKR